MDEAHERGEGFLAAQGNPAEAFELVEETFDLVALLVEAPVDGRGGSPARVGLDLRAGPEVLGDKSAQPVAVIGRVGDDMADAAQPRQQGLGLRAVAVLAWRRMDPQRQPDRIDDDVQLGRQPAGRTADGGSLSPPFAPVASA